MLRVALTGGIACGKSVVARVFRDEGCILFDADAEARALMTPGRPAWKKIVVRFGPEILRSDRTIDRAELGRRVVSDARDRAFINALIHPLVAAEQKRRAARLEREGSSGIFVVEAALTVEAGYASLFDKVVVVHCPAAVQRARLMARDGIGEAAARRKIAAQGPARDKLARADYVIDSSGSLAQTVEEAARVFAALVQDEEVRRLSVLRRRLARPAKTAPRSRRARP